LKRHHGGSAPGTLEILAAPASHGATSVTAAHDECGLEHGRQHYHAIRFVEQALRDVVRDVKNFLDHLAGISKPIIVLFLVVRASERSVGKQRQADQNYRK